MIKDSEKSILDVDSVILKNYSFLSEMGILSYIDDRNDENRYLKYVIAAAKEITRKPDIMTMLDHIAKSFLERFVPSHIVFVIEDDRGGEKPEIISYEKMQKSEPLFSIESLNPYKFFFSMTPYSVTFPVFQYMLGKPELTDHLLAANPSLVVPIMGFEQAYGFIIVGKKMVGGDYSRHEIDYINSLMTFASIGIQNNLHYLRAITDSKTRLYNHAFVMNRLDIELDRVIRYGMEIAVLITDVDYFKKFNDSYGHLTGDKILLRVSEILTKSIRKGDIAGRFGGEEFVLILANCSQEEATAAAERIRRNIEKTYIEEKGERLGVTISIGVRHVTKETARTPDELIEEADKALYYAKERGRNRCIMISPKKS